MDIPGGLPHSLRRFSIVPLHHPGVCLTRPPDVDALAVLPQNPSTPHSTQPFASYSSTVSGDVIPRFHGGEKTRDTRLVS